MDYITVFRNFKGGLCKEEEFSVCNKRGFSPGAKTMISVSKLVKNTISGGLFWKNAQKTGMGKGAKRKSSLRRGKVCGIVTGKCA